MSKYSVLIEIPKAFLTPSLITEIESHVDFGRLGIIFDESTFKPGLTDPDIFWFSHDDAENGEFAELEEFFINFQIPFDRYSDSFCEIQPEYRKYRPAKHGKPMVDITIIEDHANNSYVLCSDLKDVLHLEPAEALLEIQRLVEESDPTIIPLTFYNGIQSIEIISEPVQEYE